MSTATSITFSRQQNLKRIAYASFLVNQSRVDISDARWSSIQSQNGIQLDALFNAAIDFEPRTEF